MVLGNISTAVVSLVLGLAVAGAGVWWARREKGCARALGIGGYVWLVLLALWVLLEALGSVACRTPGLPMLAAVLLGGAAAICFSGPRLRSAHGKALAAVRPLVVALCIPVAFFLLEWPYNELLFSMEPLYVKINLFLVGSGLLAVWFLGQRRAGAAVAYLATCLGFGLADYFVCLFKEQTILPADLLAIGTAAEVSSGYTYELHESAVAAICVFIAAVAILCVLPSTILPADLLAIGTAAEVSSGYTYELHESAVAAICVFIAAVAILCVLPSARLTRKRVAVNVVVGLICLALPMAWYHDHDIEKDYGVKVDVWSTRESYQTFGSVLSFLQRVQEVEPQVPQGYSSEAANELQSALADAWDRAHPGYPSNLEEARSLQAVTTGSDELPCVVVIMNESFSDLSTYPGVQGYGGLPSFDAIDAVERGGLFTSVRGGGTCNSEFEYLTGTTLGSLGGGVYPYMFYDLDGVESLPRYFSSMGYETTAIHPAAPSNWRRDVVYRQLGFDEFLSESSMPTGSLPRYFSSMGYETTAIHPAAPSNWRRDVVYRQLGFDEFLSESSMPTGAQTLRGLITDRVTYDVILDLLGSGEEPRFIFDVTLQNHGGYDTGLLDSYPYDDVTVRGHVIEGMSEYLSCVDASQDDLTYLLDRLSSVDRKVVLVFFGDHQPGFNDQIAEAAYGVEVGSLSLEQVQQRFETPYFIWANFEMPHEGDGAGPLSYADMSVGYLMAQTAYAAGLPLTDFQKALLQLQEEIPAVNLNGYRGADGSWYWASQDGPVREAFENYALLQYADLFDKAGNEATAYAAGLPLTDFQKALLQLQEEIPAVNLNGYRGADGSWYWASQDGPVREAFENYALLQYADLFDSAGNKAFDAFVEERRLEEGGLGEKTL